MNPRRVGPWPLLFAFLLCLAPAVCRAGPYAPDTTDVSLTEPKTFEPDAHELDLRGPRIGVMVLPEGSPRSLFGWHFEHQAGVRGRGPWFVVETIFLVSGIEDHMILPSTSLVFGIRAANGYEFGIGPSLSIGPAGDNTALVIAGGRSFRFGGVRVPVNIAIATAREGQRISIVTGWALRAPPIADHPIVGDGRPAR
jgi:hypothetical protein